MAEDPVCGSGNGSAAAFIERYKQAGEATGGHIAEQGIEINRDGEVQASWEREGNTPRVKIGGEAVVSPSGQLPGHEFSRKDAIATLGFPARTVEAIIRKLLDMKKLERLGAGKGNPVSNLQ